MINQQDARLATTMLPGSKPTQSSSKRTKTRQYHGLTPLIRGRYTLDTGQIDGRYALGKTLQAWRSELVNSLGGETAISSQQSILIDMTIRDRLAIESIENWLAGQPSLVNKKKRALFPIVQQLASLKDGLTRRLVALGLERKARPTRTLQDILNGSDDEPMPDSTPTDDQAP